MAHQKRRKRGLDRHFRSRRPFRIPPVTSVPFLRPLPRYWTVRRSQRVRTLGCPRRCRSFHGHCSALPPLHKLSPNPILFERDGRLLPRGRRKRLQPSSPASGKHGEDRPRENQPARVGHVGGKLDQGSDGIRHLAGRRERARLTCCSDRGEGPPELLHARCCRAAPRRRRRSSSAGARAAGQS